MIHKHFIHGALPEVIGRLVANREGIVPVPVSSDKPPTSK